MEDGVWTTPEPLVMEQNIGNIMVDTYNLALNTCVYITRQSFKRIINK